MADANNILNLIHTNPMKFKIVMLNAIRAEENFVPVAKKLTADKLKQLRKLIKK